MSLNFLRTRVLPESPGSEVGVPFVDCVAAAFQAGAGPGTTDIVFTLPAAAGPTDVPPALVVGTAAVKGDVVIGVACITGGALDANLAIGQCWVSTAGGPGVGQITARVANLTAAAIPVAPAARTFRFFLDR